MAVGLLIPSLRPAVRPATIRRWKISTKMMIGIVTSTAAAAMVPRRLGEPRLALEEGERWGTVRDASVEVSEIAKTKSFQEKMKTRIAAVNTPGAASGTITLRKA